MPSASLITLCEYHNLPAIGVAAVAAFAAGPSSAHSAWSAVAAAGKPTSAQLLNQVEHKRAHCAHFALRSVCVYSSAGHRLTDAPTASPVATLTRREEAG